MEDDNSSQSSSVILWTARRKGNGNGPGLSHVQHNVSPDLKLRLINTSRYCRRPLNRPRVGPLRFNGDRWNRVDRFGTIDSSQKSGRTEKREDSETRMVEDARSTKIASQESVKETVGRSSPVSGGAVTDVHYALACFAVLPLVARQHDHRSCYVTTSRLAG